MCYEPRPTKYSQSQMIADHLIATFFGVAIVGVGIGVLWLAAAFYDGVRNGVFG